MGATQTAKNGISSASSITATFAAPTSSGSGIVVLMDSRSLDATFTVTDDQGNTYTQAGDIAQNGSATPNRVLLFYRPAVGATAGVSTVTLTPSAAHNMAVRIFEVPSLGTLADTDFLSAQADVEGLPVSPVAAGAGFTVGAMVVGANTRTYSILTPSGATTPGDDPTTASTNTYMMTAWKDVASAGAVAYEWDRTSGTASLAAMYAAAFNTAASNPIPVVSVGADRTVDTGSVVNITATASVSSGSIASYAWTVVSGTALTLSGASTATVSFTAPAPPGSTVLRCTVTSDLGETASDDLTVTYLTAGQYARPASDISSSGATKEPSGATTFYELIDETTASATDYIILGNGSSVRVGYSPLVPVSATTGWVWRVGLKVNDDTNSSSVRLRLMQGSTVIKTETVTGIGTTTTSYDFTLSEGEVGSIPDQSVPLELFADTVVLT